MFELGALWKQKFFELIIFLYVFFLVSRCTTAGFSILTGLTILILLYNHKYWYSIIVEFPKSFFFCYMTFFLSLFISALLSDKSIVIFDTWRYFTWTFPIFIIYFFYSISFYRQSWMYGIIGAVWVIGLVGIYQILVNDNVEIRVSSYFASPNHLATLLVVVLPCLITSFIKNVKEYGITRKNKQILLGMCCIIGIGLLFFSQSRGGIAGFILGGIFLKGFTSLCKAKKTCFFKLSTLLLCVIALSGTIYVATQTFHRSYDLERILLIKSSYAMWKDHPIYGVGFERWKDEYPLYILPEAKEPNLPMPHNSIAYFFSTTGLIGGIGFLIFTCGTIGILAMRIKKQPYNIYYQTALWSFLALTLHGMVDTGITNKAAMQIMFAILGITFATEKNINEGVEHV